jgi:hypothetical protein
MYVPGSKRMLLVTMVDGTATRQAAMTGIFI